MALVPLEDVAAFLPLQSLGHHDDFLHELRRRYVATAPRKALIVADDVDALAFGKSAFKQLNDKHVKLAIKSGAVGALHLWLTWGILVLHEYNSFMEWACKFGHLNVIQFFHERMGVTSYSRFELLYVVRQGRFDILTYLERFSFCSNEGNPVDFDNKLEKYSLVHAARHGDDTFAMYRYLHGDDKKLWLGNMVRASVCVGALDKVVKALREMKKASTFDYDIYKAMMLSARRGDLAMMKALHGDQASRTFWCLENIEIMREAAQGGHLDLLGWLLDIYTPDSQTRRQLASIALCKATTVHGANWDWHVQCQRFSGVSLTPAALSAILLHAASCGNVGVLTYFLPFSLKDANYNENDDENNNVFECLQPILHAAVLRSHLAVLQLLQRTCSLLGRCIMHGSCQLLRVASEQSILQWLLQPEFGVTRQHVLSSECLASAATQGHLPVLMLLHDYYCFTAPDMLPALHSAIGHGQLHIVQWLHTTFQFTAADAFAGVPNAIARGHLGTLHFVCSRMGVSMLPSDDTVTDALKDVVLFNHCQVLQYLCCCLKSGLAYNQLQTCMKEVACTDSRAHMQKFLWLLKN